MGAGPNDLETADLPGEFYAECEDYLTQIRRSLLTLMQADSNEASQAEALAVIFRGFHSLKGVFGLAGFREGETLAHRTEDYLRLLTRKEIGLTEYGVDVLSGVTAQLENILLAHRDNGQIPLIEPSVRQLDELMEQGEPAAGQQTSYGLEEKIRPAEQEGRKVWRCCFTPTAELDGAGVNINSIRTDLQRAGEILQSVPLVGEAGGITFEFFVATDGAEAPQARPGLTVELRSPSKESGSVPAAAAPAKSNAVSVNPSQLVRVDLTRLDELMRIMGELVVYRARLEETVNRAAYHLPVAELRALQEVNHGVGRELRHLRDGLMRVRLVPIREIFERMPLVVRDLSRQLDKRVRLLLEGQTTEIDKYLVERLKEPLLHLVRNAASHGIESPQARRNIGKPEEGTIILRAATSGERVVIEIQDDGAGIDPARVIDRGRALGMSLPDSLGPAQLLDLLCAPGFSTRQEADRASGRGVGMSAVRATVTELGGELSLSSVPGRGTTFRLAMPLTLAVTDALIISVGGQKFAVPQASVQEITTVQNAAIKRMERSELVTYRGGVLPLLRLSRLFGLGQEKREEFPVLVLGTGLNAMGLMTDRVHGQREIVVRTVNDPLLRMSIISGATELGDGKAVLILDSAGLLEHVRTGQTGDGSGQPR